MNKLYSMIRYGHSFMLIEDEELCQYTWDYSSTEDFIERYLGDLEDEYTGAEWEDIIDEMGPELEKLRYYL